MEKKLIERAAFYGLIQGMLADIAKPKREEWLEKLAKCQENNIIGEFDWTE